MDETYDYVADTASSAWDSTVDFFYDDNAGGTAEDTGSTWTETSNPWYSASTYNADYNFNDPFATTEVAYDTYDPYGTNITDVSNYGSDPFNYDPSEFNPYNIENVDAFSEDYVYDGTDGALTSSNKEEKEKEKSGKMGDKTKAALLTGALMLAKKYMTKDEMSQEELIRLKHQNDMEMAKLRASLRRGGGGGSNAAALEEARIAEHNKAADLQNLPEARVVKI